MSYLINQTSKIFKKDWEGSGLLRTRPNYAGRI